MVETKETYKLGNFLARNLKSENLGRFFQSVGGDTKEAVTNFISAQSGDLDNLALLVRSDSPNNTGLQLIHSLFLGKDSNDTTRVVGFLGYSGFECPVEVSIKTTTTMMSGIKKIKKTSTKDQTGSLPTGSDLVQADTARSAADFVAAFETSLSSEALQEAKKLPGALLLDSFAIDLLGMEQNATASDLLSQLGTSAPGLDKVEATDNLVAFLWATAKGLNPVTPSFNTIDWDTETRIHIVSLKAMFTSKEQEFYTHQLDSDGTIEEDDDDDDVELDEAGADDESSIESVRKDTDEEGDETPVGMQAPTDTTQARAKAHPRARPSIPRLAKAPPSSKPRPRRSGPATQRLPPTPPSRRRPAAALGSESEDSDDSALSAPSRRLARKRNKKRRKLEAREASRRSLLQMEQLIAAAGLIASATQVQTEDNRTRLERDLLKRSLVKNLTSEQQLMMKLVLGGDFDASPPQDLNSIQLPENAAELLKNSNLKLFENKLRQVTEDYQCQPDPGLFGHFISIDGFRKGTNSQTGGLTVFMMHPFSHQETDIERRQRISILIEDATDKDWAEKILDSSYFFPTEVDQALNMLKSCIRLIVHLSVPGGTVATEGYSLGMKLISSYRRQITIRQQDDKLFITKLLHQLDHHNQNFYGELLELMRDDRSKQYPLAYAGPCRVNRKEGIERAFHALRDGLEPGFRLPEQLLSAYRKKDSSKKSPNCPPPGQLSPPKAAKLAQPWWSVKPLNDSNAWLLPSGKSFKDFFTESDRDFLNPHLFPHHVSGRRRPICLRYIATGKCVATCFCTHIRVKQMSAPQIAEMDKKILSLYASK